METEMVVKAVGNCNVIKFTVYSFRCVRRISHLISHYLAMSICQAERYVFDLFE